MSLVDIHSYSQVQSSVGAKAAQGTATGNQNFLWLDQSFWTVIHSPSRKTELSCAMSAKLEAAWIIAIKWMCVELQMKILAKSG
jgi:hypothetical protein